MSQLVDGITPRCRINVKQNLLFHKTKLPSAIKLKRFLYVTGLHCCGNRVRLRTGFNNRTVAILITLHNLQLMATLINLIIKQGNTRKNKNARNLTTTNHYYYYVEEYYFVVFTRTL